MCPGRVHGIGVNGVEVTGQTGKVDNVGLRNRASGCQHFSANFKLFKSQTTWLVVGSLGIFYDCFIVDVATGRQNVPVCRDAPPI